MPLRDAHPLLYRPQMRVTFREGMQNFPTFYTQWMKTGTIDGPEITATSVTGPKRLFETKDGEQLTYVEITSGPLVAAVDKEYKAGYFVTKTAVEDDKSGFLNRGAEFLAHAAQMTKEYSANALLDDAFTGTYFKGSDGLPLMSTGHTLIGDSATVANMPSTPVSLSVAGFTALMDLARKAKDPNGDPMMMNPDTLMIGNDQGQINKAYQILESQLEPFTANNQDNPIRRNFKPKNVIINPYMTNTSHWFLIDSTKNSAQFLERAPVVMKDWYDEEVDAFKTKARGRWLVWFNSPMGWVGSNPSA